MIDEIEKELKKYKKIERAIFFTDVTLSLLIIFFSQKIIQTTLGQAALWFSLTLLGIIAIMKIFKMFGPKN